MAANVYVGIITRDDIYWETVWGLMADVTSPEPTIARFLVQPTGPYLDDGRNLAIEKYMKEDGTETTPWFLFLDSDVFARDRDNLGAQIRELIAPGGVPLHGERFPVICGVYRNPTPTEGIKPVVYSWEADEGQFRQFTDKELGLLPSYQHPLDSAPIHSDITDVGAAGTGFMAIHRSLILKMFTTYGFPQPWFWEPVLNGIHFGEDMGFCLRLGELGVPVLVHRGVRLDHYKPQIIRGTGDHRPRVG